MLGWSWKVGLVGGVCLSYLMSTAFGNSTDCRGIPLESNGNSPEIFGVITLEEYKSTQHLSFALLMHRSHSPIGRSFGLDFGVSFESGPGD